MPKSLTFSGMALFLPRVERAEPAAAG